MTAVLHPPSSALPPASNEEGQLGMRDTNGFADPIVDLSRLWVVILVLLSQLSEPSNLDCAVEFVYP